MPAISSRTSPRTRSLRLLTALTAALAATSIYAATYPAWQVDTFYRAGTVVSYNGHDYQALVDQVDYASTGWNPTTASLWKDLGASSNPPAPAPAPAPTPAPAACRVAAAFRAAIDEFQFDWTHAKCAGRCRG